MASSLFNLSGKVAIITGASSGIGAATAVLFAKLGASLSLSGRNEEYIQKTIDECSKQPGATSPLSTIAEMTNEQDVEKLIDATLKKFGKIDILVNNAGIIEFGSIETTSLEQYDRMFQVNVRDDINPFNTNEATNKATIQSVYHLTILAVPHLIKAKGSIVNVSSVCGTRSFSGVLSYCMSKSAIDQFTSCIALELAPKGVRVNAVNPGVVITELQKRGGLDQEAYDKFIARTKETHPLGRPGETDEVARAIAFLASDAASFTTGDHLHIDGGRHAACPR